MNKTNFQHGWAALVIQIIVLVLTHDAWLGAYLAIGFYLGREHAQQEYKYAKNVATLKWYAGFTGWSKDKIYDVLVPIVFTVTFSFSIKFI